MSIPTNTQTASAVFRQTHPLGFNLLDDDDQQVLFIADDATGHDLRLEVHNTSQQEIALAKPASDVPSKDNYHFELRFRPGTLWQPEGIQLAAPSWKFAQGKAENYTSLYFLRLEPVTLAPDSRLTIPLRNITADGRGGARGTRVELRYAQLHYSSDSSIDLTGAGIQHLSIVNERGRRQVPFHVGFVGSNTILNDGSSLNERRLRITNILDADIPLLDAGDACSKLILSFDISADGSQKPWALMEKGQVSALDPKVTLNEWEVRGTDKEGDPPTWTICPKNGNVVLKAGASVELKLSGLKSSMPSGPANVYLRYENIPGYWDGQFTANLEKTHLVQRDQETVGSSFIGIGTAAPAFPLSFADKAGDKISLFGQPKDNYGFGIQPGLLQVHTDAAGADIAFGYGRSDAFQETMRIKGNGNVGIGSVTPEAKLQIISQNQDPSGGALILGPTTQSNLRLGYHEGYSWIQSHGNKPLAINVAGNNVGIGTPAAEQTLHVNGANEILSTGSGAGFRFRNRGSTSSADDWVWYSDGNLAHFWRSTVGDLLTITKEGNVGIGTSTPSRRLEINNAMKLTNSGSDSNDGVIGTGTFGPGLNLVGIRTDNTYRKFSLWGEITQHQNDGTNTWQGTNYFSGNVGIGASTSSAPLYVGISRRVPHGISDQFAYVGYQWNSNRGNDFQWGLSDRGQPQYVDDTSILAEGRVVCRQFVAFSDDRIKTNLRASDRSDALNLLNELKVTDYQLKDSLAHGSQYHRGFVAQEVERFFPQAVSQRSDFIPDIYALAEETAVDHGVLTARLQDPHNLAEGDMVRLITETEGIKEVAVTVVDERTFAVKDWTAPPGPLFVHGRKVDDFRTLDYQQIFALGISGIQQLSIEVNELKAANAKLRKRLQLLETKLEIAPSPTRALSSSNGNGRHASAKVRTRRTTNGKTKR
jgi:hypothetical protein